MEVTLDEYGRIVVPKPLRDRLGIGAGTELTIEEENGHLVLKPIPEHAVLEERNGLLVSTAEINSDVNVEAVIDDVRKARTQTITGTEPDE